MITVRIRNSNKVRYLSSPLGQGLPRVLKPPAVIRILAIAPGPVLAFRPRIILLPAAATAACRRVVRVPGMRLLREVVRIFAVAAGAVAASRPAASGRAAASRRRTFLTRRFFGRRFRLLLFVAVQVVGGRNHCRKDDLAR